MSDGKMTFEEFVLQATGRDVEYHRMTKTTGLEFAKAAWTTSALKEREACAKICDEERAKFAAKAGKNDGRESDFAFGSVNSAEQIKSAIMARSNANVCGLPQPEGD